MMTGPRGPNAVRLCAKKPARRLVPEISGMVKLLLL